MKPVLYSIPAFDPYNESQDIAFYWAGNKLVSATITVYRPDDNGELVSIYEYTGTPTVDLIITIPSGADIPYITKNSEFIYTAKLKVDYQDTNDDGETITVTSDESDGVSLYSYQNPTFIFENIWTGKIIRTSSFNVELTYSQSAGEPLSYFKIDMYNSNWSLITTSGKIYDENIRSYLFDGLVGGEKYYFVATGETQEGTKLQTDAAEVRIRYSSSPANMSVVAETERCNGQVRIRSFINANLYVFDEGGEDDPGRFSGDTWINLIDNGLTYTNSTGLIADNTLGARIKNPQDGELILELFDGDKIDNGRLYYFVIEQNIYDSMMVYGVERINEDNPFDPNISLTNVKQSTDIVERFTTRSERDAYHQALLDRDDYKEADNRALYPVPTNDKTTRYYAYFIYEYGINTIHSDYIQIDPTVDNIWKVVLMNLDGEVTLNVTLEK